MSPAAVLESALGRLNPRVVEITRLLPEHRDDDLIVFHLECREPLAGLPVTGLARDVPPPDQSAPAWEDRAFLRPQGPREQDHRLWVRRGVLLLATDAGALRHTLECAERTTLRWQLRDLVVELDRRRPVLMGVVNVTPDSFSDGGRFLETEDAVAQGERLAASGAAFLDVGGESTRPGSEFVSEEQELERVVPVIERLAANTAVPVSIDTRKSRVAAAALQAGARLVNDTSALADDPEMAAVVASTGAGLILMHRQGIPKTMQEAPSYGNCRAEVAAALRGAAAHARAASIAADRLMVDPGIGFGKRLRDNLDLLHHLGELRSLGFPVLLGASRKRFLGRITGRDVGDREAATLATTAVAHREGAHVIRVHDVQASSDLLQVLATRDHG